MSRRDWDEACELWAEMRQRFPVHAPACIRGAAALLEAGRLEECEAVANEAMERFPQRCDAHCPRAELAMHRRDWDEACERWGEVRGLFPEHPAGYLRGVVALMEAGRLEECEAIADETVELFPDRHEGFFHRAELAMRQRRWELVCERWSEIRELFPDSSSGFVRGAAALLEAGRLEEGEAVAGEAIERFPDRHEGFFSSRRAGDAPAALEDGVRAVA